MRAGAKLVLTIIVAFLLHWVFYFLLADPVVAGNPLLNPLVSSLFLNLAGIPLGIYLGKTGRDTSGAGFLGYGRTFVSVIFFWVFIFGFLAAPGLFMGKFVADAIRESGEISPAGSVSRPSFSLAPVMSHRMHR